MADEYTSRYQGMTHEELYTALMTGNPTTVQAASDSWAALATSLAQLADAVGEDLEAVITGWDSTAGDEFQRRIQLIVDFTLNLAEEQSQLAGTLGVWAEDLTTAQAEAEPPEQAQADANAAYEEAVATNPGVIGTSFGQVLADQAYQEAHDRMVSVVSTVATIYDGNAGIEPTVVEPDPDMPGTDVIADEVVKDRGSVAAKTSDATTTLTTRTTSASTATATTPTSYDGGVANPALVAGSETASPDQVSALASADGTGVAGLATATSAGSGGVPLTQMALGGAGAGGGAGTGGLGLGMGASGTAVPAGGILASSNATGLRGSTPTLAEGTAGQASGSPSRSMSTTTGAGSRATGNPEDDPDEHDTWLTEDDMVWGDQGTDDIPPAVLE